MTRTIVLLLTNVFSHGLRSGLHPLYADLDQFDDNRFRIPVEPFHDLVETVMDNLGLTGQITYFVVAFVIALAALLVIFYGSDLISKGMRRLRTDLGGMAGSGDQSEKRLRSDLSRATRKSDWGAAAACSEALGQASEAAKYYQMAGKYDKAGTLYEMKGDYSSAASCYASNRQYEKAADLYVKGKDELSAAAVLEKTKNFIRAAVCYEKAGRHDRAAAMLDLHFKNRSAQAGGDIDLLKRCARIYEKAQKQEKAAECYLQAGSLQKAGELYEAIGKKAEAADLFSKARDFERAARLFEEAGELKKAGEMRGMLHSMNGEYAAAAKNYVRAEDYGRAAECFHAAGQYRDAAQMYLKAGYNVEAAESLARTDQWLKAAEIYEKSDSPEAAAALYEKHFDLQKAIDCYRRAGKHYRAGHLLMKIDKLDEALEMFDSVEKEDAEYLMAEAETGVCLFRMNNIEEAGDILEKALADLSPGSDTIEFFYTMGLIYERAGRRHEARKIYRKIAAEDESFLDIKERLQKLSASTAETSNPPYDRTVKLTEASGGIEQRYEILRELGRGGMGVVFQARDKLLDRDVVLKQLSRSVVDAEEEARERFLREARAASRLSHPNIVSVYDVIEDRDDLFIAMEYVDGISLRQYLKEHPLPPFKFVLAIAAQVADALQSAHDKGVIHRDVKPDNIMITKKGKAKITDFGIAYMSESTMTLSGSVMGTLKYMSPEQVTGQKATAATDIYSFGVVLYEMVTGAPPFTKGELTFHHVHTAPPPPREANQNVPEPLERIILKCLAKDPAQRYAAAHELLAELKTVQAGL